MGNASSTGSAPFDVVEERNGYQIRKYQPTKWVGIEIKSSTCEYAYPLAYKRLCKYISGDNVTGQRIPMTFPVIVKITPNKETGKTTFITHFYLPSEYQGKSDSEVPYPNNPEVKIYDYSEFTAYVIRYGGFSNDGKLSNYTIQLENLLKNDEIVNYKSEYSFYASYDPLHRICNRCNEIWFLATSEEGKTTQESTKEEERKEETGAMAIEEQEEIKEQSQEIKKKKVTMTTVATEKETTQSKTESAEQKEIKTEKVGAEVKKIEARSAEPGKDKGTEDKGAEAKDKA